MRNFFGMLAAAAALHGLLQASARLRRWSRAEAGGLSLTVRLLGCAGAGC